MDLLLYWQLAASLSILGRAGPISFAPHPYEWFALFSSKLSKKVYHIKNSLSILPLVPVALGSLRIDTERS